MNNTLKRKVSCINNCSNQTCDICSFDDPILFVEECGHHFHSRCVNCWPLTNCPVCDIKILKVSLVKVDMNEKVETRCGKWSKEEEDYLNVISKDFGMGYLPLANGAPVRMLLAKLLNCSPMRLSKKFQKNALGKRTHQGPKSLSNTIDTIYKVHFDKHEHVQRSREFSKIEKLFREQVLYLRQQDNSKIDGELEIKELRLAVQQFWLSQFLKYAMTIGQQITGLDTSIPAKKKLALAKMRHGLEEQALLWSAKNKLTSKQTNIEQLSSKLSNTPTTQKLNLITQEWGSTLFWKPLETDLNNDKSMILKSSRPSSLLPITPLGLKKNDRKNSMDESIFELLGLDMDQILDTDIFGIRSGLTPRGYVLTGLTPKGFFTTGFTPRCGADLFAIKTGFTPKNGNLIEPITSFDFSQGWGALSIGKIFSGED